MGTGIKITVGGFVFSSKKAFTERCQNALYGGDLETVLTGEDAELAQAVFYTRLDKAAQLNGRTVLHYIRGKHPHNTACFFAVLSDGEKLHFSFKKIIQPNKA